MIKSFPYVHGLRRMHATTGLCTSSLYTGVPYLWHEGLSHADRSAPQGKFEQGLQIMEEATSEDIPQEIKDRHRYARLQMLCELSNINISRARAEVDPRERVNHMIRATGPLDRARLLDPTDQLVHLTHGHLLFASVSPPPMHAVPMQWPPDKGHWAACTGPSAGPSSPAHAPDQGRLLLASMSVSSLHVFWGTDTCGCTSPVAP